MELLEAAKQLRAAQRAYMAARNEDGALTTWKQERSPELDALGKKVAEAAIQLDEAIEQSSRREGF